MNEKTNTIKSKETAVDTLLSQKKALHMKVYPNDDQTWKKDKYTSDAGKVKYHMIQCKWELKNGFYFDWAISPFGKDDCLAFDAEMMEVNRKLVDALDDYKFALLDAYVESDIEHDGWLNTFNPDMSQAIEKLKEIRPRLDQKYDYGGQKLVDEIIPKLEASDDSALFDIFNNYRGPDGGNTASYSWSAPQEFTHKEWEDIQKLFFNIQHARRFQKLATYLRTFIENIILQSQNTDTPWSRYYERIAFGLENLELKAFTYLEITFIGNVVIQNDALKQFQQNNNAEIWTNVIRLCKLLWNIYHIRIESDYQKYSPKIYRYHYRYIYNDKKEIKGLGILEWLF